MLRPLTQRPSLAVVLCATVVVSIFAARGDLPLRRDHAPTAPRPAAGQPVVVRADQPERKAPVRPLVLKGRVYDSLGFLVVGAEVQPLGGAAVRTDADGVFRAEVPRAACVDLRVQAKGYRAAIVRASTAGPDQPVVQLEPSAPWDGAPAALPPLRFDLRGEGTLRRPDGAPLAGAFVRAAGSPWWASTDDTGRYELALGGPEVSLVVHGPDGERGGFALRAEPLQLPRDRGAVPLPELTAAPAAAIRGVVRDARGNPLAGVPVQVRSGGFERTCESGPSGMFRVAGLLPGDYLLRPLAYRGAIGRTQQLRLDQPVVDCELRVEPTTGRRVRVVDEQGRPVGGAYVAAAVDGLRRAVAQADAEGWTEVAVGEAAADFEVRGGEDFTALPVRRFDPQPGTLVIAMP